MEACKRLVRKDIGMHNMKIDRWLMIRVVPPIVKLLETLWPTLIELITKNPETSTFHNDKLSHSSSLFPLSLPHISTNDFFIIQGISLSFIYFILQF